MISKKGNYVESIGEFIMLTVFVLVVGGMMSKAFEWMLGDCCKRKG
jgi:hypothetical protein